MEKETGHKIKINGYSNKKRLAKKEKKRQEAEIRNKTYSLLSKEEKIRKAKKARGNSKQQLVKLGVKI